MFLSAVLLGAWSVSGCAASQSDGAAGLSAEDRMLTNKFRGLRGVVLRIDAASEKEYVSITSEKGVSISRAGRLHLGQVSNQTYTDNSSMPIPKTVRAVWRRAADPQKGLTMVENGWSGGTIIGDYTVPVAQRIPDEVLDYIRKNGGALRLKIRLHDRGIAIGWDVEERYTTQYGSGVRWVRPGGDFREAQIFNGKVTDPGWQNY